MEWKGNNFLIWQYICPTIIASEQKSCPNAADADGIDASIGGIVKRVVVLLLALSGLGTALFYLGLKYAFVDTPY